MATVYSASSGDTAHTDPREDRSTSLGELLRRARERRGLTLEKIANETKIPQRHLEALERDNLAAIQGFYQRAEIRAYARAVGLDQNLALAQLESLLKPVDAREALREKPRTQASTRPRTYGLIGLALGVVVVAAVMFGRPLSEPTATLEQSAETRSVADSQPTPVLIRNASPETVTPQREQAEAIARPSPRSQSPTAVSIEPTGAAAASDAGLPVTTEVTDARASAGSLTELIVTTQPAGARVTVNGIGWGVSPVTIQHLPPGDKRIRVSKEGYATEERVLRLAEGRRRALDVRLDRAP